MNHIQIVRLLINYLPDSIHEDDTWDYAWEALSDDAQKEVKAARKAAREFVSEHQLDKLDRAVIQRAVADGAAGTI